MWRAHDVRDCANRRQASAAGTRPAQGCKRLILRPWKHPGVRLCASAPLRLCASSSSSSRGSDVRLAPRRIFATRAHTTSGQPAPPGSADPTRAASLASATAREAGAPVASTSASLLGTGSERTIRFALQDDRYRVHWEARPVLRSSIGCIVRGAIEDTAGRRIGEPFGAR